MGDTRSIPTLAHELTKLGHEVDLLQAWKEWQHLDPPSHDSGFGVVSLRTRWFVPVLPNISKISAWASYRIYMAVIALAMMPGLIWYLKRRKPDVLVVRMLTTPVILAVKLLQIRTRVLVSTGGMPRQSAFRNWLWPLVYPRADGIVASAPGVAEMIGRISGVEVSDIDVLWDPVLDDEAMSSAQNTATHKWFVDEGAPIVMALGRLSRQKDFITLVRAFDHTSKRVDARLVIFGEGEERKMLEAEVHRLGLGEKVDFPGFIDEPFAHLKKCSVFVLSSLWEGSSHALIEAQGLGVPSVTTDCPSGQREIAMDGETALVIPVGDSDAMGDAIARLISDQTEANRISRNAVDNSSRFRPQTVSIQWEKKIIGLVGNDELNT
jgi:glycosyltransferase involved in cell wall biosynthesis